jgi:agmatine deiminase
MIESRYWPAEWHPHDATWLAWPHNRDTWPFGIDRIEPCFERLVRILAEVEPVHVLGGPESSLANAIAALDGINNVTVHPIETNDVWIRDYGPTFVIDRESKSLVAVDWQYNAWGGKWPPWDQDAANASRIASHLNVMTSSSRLTCEGGALETDGEGTLLTTSSCLLSVTRNPGLTREAIERELQTQLGIERVLWIDGGSLAGDDTDSHIDQLVRFTKPGRVVAAISSNASDQNGERLQAQLVSLRQAIDALGSSLEIVPLPTPAPRYIGGKRVPESYCNFYIANSIVVVPIFGQRRTDDAAIQILKNEFPKHDIVTIESLDLIGGLGAIHCATQQQPSVLL